jgi:alpha-tubulin suppressor-like RCC1 family protein
VDIDECARGLDDCDAAPDACVNDLGTFHCKCPVPFQGDGKGPRGCTCPRADYSPLCAPWSQISSSSGHACAISGGALFCWGQNDQAQLGTGDNADRMFPTRVGADADWDYVNAGDDHTCGIRAGALYCWGAPGLGALGHDGSGLLPGRVGNDNDWQTVAAGLGDTCGIRAGGQLYCWGWNGHGQAGVGGAETIYANPQRVVSLDGASTVSMWNATVCAIANNGLYCWGALPGSGADQNLPVQISGFTDWTTVDVRGQLCALRAGGALYCWGVHGATPQALLDRSDWTSISAGSAYYCGTTSGGQGYCSGGNSDGVLGDGTVSNSETPTPALLDSPAGWEALEASDSTTFGIHAGGLYSWGLNERGHRGSAFSIGRVGGDSDWLAVSAGLLFTCGIRQPGGLYCWGQPQADSGPPNGLITPAQVGIGNDWTRISVGWVHTCGIRGGAAYCWGGNPKGGLGDGTLLGHADPARVGSRSDWVQVSASTGSNGATCGVHSDGELECWGADESGQLGDASTTDRPTPVLVSGTDYSIVSLGDDFTCAINDGGLFCWGAAGDGRLGNGAATGIVTSPVRVGGDATWTSLSTGLTTACALDAGALYCWGRNLFGQLGVGQPSADIKLPTIVAGQLGWLAIAAGAFHTCAVTSGGLLYCWGQNSLGQLGTGDFTDRAAPAQVGQLAGWQQVSAGNDYTCAIRAGELYCWGSNGAGKLGTGDGLRPAPVATGLDIE